MMKHALAVLAAGGLAALVAAPAGAQEGASDAGASYEGTLSELNGSGGSGTATVTVSQDGTTLAVEVSASGLNLDGPHAMHLHGIVEDDEVAASSCPTLADDADGDGVLTVVEGAPRYGGVQLSLTTEGDTSPDSALAVERFPAGTEVDYSRSGIPLPENLRADVGKLHVVIHGIDENGNGTLDADQAERSSLTEDLPREATAPALCGTLTATAEGPIQTGAGGLAAPAPADGSDPEPAMVGAAVVSAAAAAGAGAAGVGAVGVLARRRRTRTA